MGQLLSEEDRSRSRSRLGTHEIGGPEAHAAVPNNWADSTSARVDRLSAEAPSAPHDPPGTDRPSEHDSWRCPSLYEIPGQSDGRV